MQVFVLFEGITRKLDYLKWCGIRNLWVTPFFKSPMIDNGYDIADYYDVDPLFGNLNDFKMLVEKIKFYGMRLILDMVLNHTSDEHPWFLASVKSEEPYKDYYVWHDGKIDQKTGSRIPPNNWQSCFGDSAWTFNDQRQQFYLHTFHYKQPNLNCRNPIVIQEFFEILTFWIDHGVDGFRIDAVKHLIYDNQFRDNVFGDCSHVICRYDWEQPELYDLVRKICSFAKDYGRSSYGREILVVTEAYTDLHNMKKYYGDAQVDMPFNFCLIGWQKSSNNAGYLRRVIQETIDLCHETQSWPNWVLGNHDTNRIASRLGGEDCPVMTDLANMLLLCLP
uniref:Alpha-amylase n=1 Tax=Romanomermis culicivorax TaxID=13658 RepID=A0A915KEE8_ROMCU